MAAGIMHVKSISSVDSETRNKPAAGTSTSLDEDVSDHSYFSTELDSVKSDRIQRRKFRMSWKNTFSWLCYDNVKDVMFCKACREVLSSEYADEPYVEGTRDFRITAIQNHEMSRIHVSAVKKKILIKKKASKKIKVDKEEETTEKPKSVENDRKPQGILSAVTLDGKVLTNWTMEAIPITKDCDISEMFKFFERNPNYPCKVPGFYYANFQLPSGTEPGDTFLDPTGWTKGVAFVNGFNLGRYWPVVGPQVTLYVPGVLLRPHPQMNTLVLLEMEGNPDRKSSNDCKACSVRFTDTPSFRVIAEE